MLQLLNGSNGWIGCFSRKESRSLSLEQKRTERGMNEIYRIVRVVDKLNMALLLTKYEN